MNPAADPYLKHSDRDEDNPAARNDPGKATHPAKYGLVTVRGRRRATRMGYLPLICAPR